MLYEVITAGKYGGFANNSFFSTSYMHWAEFGVVTYSFAVGLLFVLSDSLYSIYKKNVEPLALTFVSVITSYSIHYTKLYDLIRSCPKEKHLKTHKSHS